MNSFLSALGQKLAERWITLLVLPGLLFLVTAFAAHNLGQTHAVDFHLLASRITQWIQTPAMAKAGGQIAVLGVILIGAAAAGLAAQALGSVVQIVTLAEGWRTWPRPMRRWAGRRVAHRHARWNAARQRYQQQLDVDARSFADTGQRPDSSEREAAFRAVQAVADEEPDRPTWCGDRIHAVAVRLGRDHHLDVMLVWPPLWLNLTEATRAEIDGAEQALARAAVLAGWAFLYGVLVVSWWPAACIAAVLALIARHRLRTAITMYAHLVEAAIQLYSADLAVQLRIDHTGPLDTSLGEALRQHLQSRSHYACDHGTELLMRADMHVRSPQARSLDGTIRRSCTTAYVARCPSPRMPAA